MSGAAAGPRDAGIDLLRCLAALAVVAFHFVSRGPTLGELPLDVPETARALAGVGYLGVHLFFIISGYVILMTAMRSDLCGFVASRLSRLVPAFWVGVALTTLVAIVTESERYIPGLTQVLLNLTLMPDLFGAAPVDGVYWSLSVEIHFYALVAIVLALRLIDRAEWLVAAWLVISVLELAVVPSWQMQVWFCTRWAPLFAAGVLFYRLRSHGGSPARWVLLAFSAILAGIQAWVEASRVGDAGVGVPPWVAAIVVPALYLPFLAWDRGYLLVRPRPWIALGAALSYPLYLVHQNIGYMVGSRLAQSGLSAVWAMTIVSALAIALAWSINRLVERPLARPLRSAVSGAFASIRRNRDHRARAPRSS
ncbi:MAG: acyltransferase [Burkholderiaceae bacterium]|nr:acyltransferase [Burkholderiaceae bacterium]